MKTMFNINNTNSEIITSLKCHGSLKCIKYPQKVDCSIKPLTQTLKKLNKCGSDSQLIPFIFQLYTLKFHMIKVNFGFKFYR